MQFAFTGLITLALSALTIAVPAPQTRRPDYHGIQFCAHAYCEGGKPQQIVIENFELGKCHDLAREWNDRISAFTFAAENYKLVCTMYEHQRCQGKEYKHHFLPPYGNFKSGIVAYVGNEFNDRASSWRCTKG